MAVPWLVSGAADGVGGWGPGLLFSFATLAVEDTPKKDLTREDYLALMWHYLPMLGFVLLAVLVLYLITRWRKRVASRPSASDQLTEFRMLYDQGQITRTEFERLRNMLGDRMKKEIDSRLAGANKPPHPPPESPPPKPDSPETGITPLEPG